MTNSILSFLFSLIGFKPIEEEQAPKEEEEEACEYLASSTFVVEEQHFNEKTNIRNNDWLCNLSKMDLCKILSSTIADYPQVADGIYTRHYKKNKDDLEDLKSLRNQAKLVCHSLDNLRPSEQFGRASEISNALQLLLYAAIENHHSFVSLFGLIILAQESLNCPSEVRQHIFSDVKFGRAIILEISKVLKNFNLYNCGDFNYKWSLLSDNHDSWFDSLQHICTRLSRYDITWEYRKEYGEVILISQRYYKHQ
ncbi:hypothetical protein INT47_013230 [Mucor saturninus]|uniref:Uncharacterized protein n=1 Tax=Mucor saturninus TaxID=64648 RepID=A0A8H7R202_9FUNG|nr:hypothetical protein INT47_013230 [Mucor saturninus]